MFISFDILFMVNSNQRKGAEVAANCLLCIYLSLTVHVGNWELDLVALTASNCYIILENF